MNKFFFLFLVLLPACGLCCNNDEKTIHVYAPPGSVVFDNGVPVGGPGSLVVDNHRDHVLSARHPDGTTQACTLDSHVRPLYAVVDIILFETIIPLVVDAVSSDWSSISTDGCSL